MHSQGKVRNMQWEEYNHIADDTNQEEIEVV